MRGCREGGHWIGRVSSPKLVHVRVEAIPDFVRTQSSGRDGRTRDQQARLRFSAPVNCQVGYVAAVAAEYCRLGNATERSLTGCKGHVIAAA